MPEPWVSVEPMAGHSACSVDSIHRGLAWRGLPGHRIGRAWRFKVGEGDAWVRGDDANELADKAAS